jgi:hypothetical protein
VQSCAAPFVSLRPPPRSAEPDFTTKPQSDAPVFTLHFSIFAIHFTPPTNKLDFQGPPDLDRRPRSRPRIAPMRTQKSPLGTHNPMPTRLIPIQAMKRSKGE